MQIYCDREQVGQGETQNTQPEEGRNIRRCNVGAKSYVQGNKILGKT